MQLMRGSSHIRNFLIAIEYQNFRQTVDVYLLCQSASSNIGKLRSQKTNTTFNKSHFNLFEFLLTKSGNLQ